ncbi:MAG: hypothetical protein AB2L24_26795 [Mangrovibacterium sp.]
MKYIKTIWILLFAALSVPAQGQTVFKINQYNIIYNGDFMPVATLYTNYSFNSKIGFTSYFYINGYNKNSWGEGLAGPNWTPAKGVSLAFLAGFQSNEKSLLRVSPVFFVAKNRFSAFGAFEYGGERHRWDLMAFHSLDQFKIGGELIRFYQMYAAGPRVEYSFLKKQPLTIFYSGLWDWKGEKYASMFGIYTSFGSNN